MSLENLPLPIQDSGAQGGVLGNITGLVAAVSGVLEQIVVTRNLILTTSTLDTAQSIQTTSAPRFAGLTIGSGSGLALLTGGVMSAVTLGATLAVTAGTLNVRTGGGITALNGTLDTVQPIDTIDAPTFAGLTLGSGADAFQGILSAVDGVVAPIETGPSLIFSSGYNRLDTIQALSTMAYPTFRGITIGNTSGLALLTGGVMSSVTLGANLSIASGVLNVDNLGGSVSLGPSLYYNGGQIDTRQDIRTSASPTFAGLTLGTLSGLLAGVAGAVSTVTIGGSLSLSAGVLDIRTSATPTFAGLTLGTLSGLLAGTAGVVSAVALSSNLTLAAGVLDTVQDIDSTASPTFAGLTLGAGPDIFNGILGAISGQVAPVTPGAGLIFNSTYNTLSTVQDIRSTAAPTFAGLTLGNLTLGTLSGLLVGTAGTISTATLSGNLTLSAGLLDTVQDIRTTAAPTFAGLTLGVGLGAFSGVLGAIAGQVAPITPGAGLIFNTTYNTLSLAQDIRTSAAPTFSALTIGGLSLGGYSGVLYAAAGTVAAAAVGSNLDLSTGTLNLAGHITLSGLTLGAGTGPAWIAAGVLAAAALGGNLEYAAGVLNLADDVTVATLKVGTLNGLLVAASGTVAAVTLGAGLSYVAGTLNTTADLTLSSLTLGASSGLLCRLSGTVQNVTLDTNLSFSAGGTLSIATSPTFTNLTLSIADGLIIGVNGQLTHAAVGSNLTLTAGTLNLAASPTLTGLTLGTLGGLLYATAGVVSAVTLDTNLTLNAGLLALNSTVTLDHLMLGTGPDVFQGILSAVDGQVTPITPGASLIFNSTYNTLSTVQDIRTTASPTFAAATLDSLTLGTSSGVLCRVSGAVQNVMLGTNLSFAAGTLSLAASPTLTGLTIGTLGGLLCAAAGAVSTASLGTNLSFSAGTLSLAASPTLTGLTIGTLGGLLYAASGAVSTATLGTNLSFASGTLSLSSNPVLANVTVGSSTGLIYRNAGLISDVTLSPNLSFSAGTLGIAATPTLTGLTLGTLSGLLYATVGSVSSVTLGGNLALGAGVLDVAPSPTLAGLSLGIGAEAFNGMLGAINGQVATVTPGSSLIFNTTYNTFSTVQDIRTTASPTFAAMTLTGLTASALVYTTASNVLASAGLSENLTLTAGVLDTVQAIGTSAAPTFAGLTIGTGASAKTGILGALDGVVDVIQYSSSLTFSSNTLTTAQDIRTTASLTFAALTLTGLTASTLVYSNASSLLASVTLGTNLTLVSGTLNAVGGTANSTIATDNVVIGTSAFNVSASGTNNAIYGSNAASSATSMTGCVVVGSYAAPLDTTARNCVLLGAYTKLATVADVNSMVIGTSATGRGSNTAVYGNSGITNHYFTAGTVSMDALIINNLAPNTGILSASGGAVSTLTTAALTSTLAGLSPSFNTLTVQNLTISTVYSGLLKATAGVVSAAAAGVDYQAPMSGGGNVVVAGNTISLNANPTFNAATVSSLTVATSTVSNETVTNLTLANVSSGLIKSNAGVLVQATGNADYQMPLTVTGSLTLSSNVLSNFLYSVNLYNNGVATVSQVEQWVLNSAMTNTGTTPTITSGVITGLAVGLYNITLTGAVNLSNQTIYPQLQYKASGGSFTTLVQTAAAFSAASFCPVHLTADIRIANVLDAIQIYYSTGTIYGNTGVVPPIYNNGGYSGYLNRYLRITYMAT